MHGNGLVLRLAPGWIYDFTEKATDSMKSLCALNLGDKVTKHTDSCED